MLRNVIPDLLHATGQYLHMNPVYSADGTEVGICKGVASDANVRDEHVCCNVLNAPHGVEKKLIV